MSNIVLTKNADCTTQRTTITLTTATQFTFATQTDANGNVSTATIRLGGALVATLNGTNTTYVAQSPGEYTLEISGACNGATICTNEWLLGGGAAVAPVAPIDFEVNRVCSSVDGRQIFQQIDYSGGLPGVFTYVEVDGSAVADGSTGVVCVPVPGVDIEQSQTCIEESTTGEQFTRVIWFDVSAPTIPISTIFLNTAGTVVAAPANPIVCEDQRDYEVDRVCYRATVDDPGGDYVVGDILDLSNYYFNGDPANSVRVHVINVTQGTTPYLHLPPAAPVGDFPPVSDREPCEANNPLPCECPVVDEREYTDGNAAGMQSLAVTPNGLREYIFDNLIFNPTGIVDALDAGDFVVWGCSQAQFTTLMTAGNGFPELATASLGDTFLWLHKDMLHQYWVDGVGTLHVILDVSGVLQADDDIDAPTLNDACLQQRYGDFTDVSWRTMRAQATGTAGLGTGAQIIIATPRQCEDIADPNYETKILCDDNGQFIREFKLVDGHVVTKDFLFTAEIGSGGNHAAYTPVGTVGVCPVLDPLPVSIAEVKGCLKTDVITFGTFTALINALGVAAELDIGGEAAIHINGAAGTVGNLSGPYSSGALITALDGGPTGPGWGNVDFLLTQDPLLAGVIGVTLEIFPADDLTNVIFSLTASNHTIGSPVKVIQSVTHDVDGTNVSVIEQSILEFPGLAVVTLPLAVNQQLDLECSPEPNQILEEETCVDIRSLGEIGVSVICRQTLNTNTLSVIEGPLYYRLPTGLQIDTSVNPVSKVDCRCPCVPEACVRLRSFDVIALGDLDTENVWPMTFDVTETLDGVVTSNTIVINRDAAWVVGVTTLCEVYQSLVTYLDSLIGTNASCYVGNPLASGDPLREGSLQIEFPCDCDWSLVIRRRNASTVDETITLINDLSTAQFTAFWDMTGAPLGSGNAGYGVTDCNDNSFGGLGVAVTSCSLIQ